MNYTFEVMTQEQAEEIAFKWHYEDKYSFYDMEADQEDLVEFLDPKIRGETTFAVSENNRLVGFFSFNKVDIHTVDIGLGMKPNLTGNGLGLVFIKASLVFCEKKDQPKYITLSVQHLIKEQLMFIRKQVLKQLELLFKRQMEVALNF